MDEKELEQCKSPADKSDGTLSCSLCGQDDGDGDVQFSKRQRNRALFEHQPPKCTACIETQQQSSSSQKRTATSEISAVIDLSGPVPKKKKTSKRRRGLSQSDSDGDGDENDGETPASVSLDAIKREILGRDTLHIPTPAKAALSEQDADLAQIRQLFHATPETDPSGSSSLPIVTAAAAAKGASSQLVAELSCAICQELLYPPVSLSCGHSFCQECLAWWWKTQKTCPTCRSGGMDTRTTSTRTLPQVNMALKHCIVHLFGPQLIPRIRAKAKATAGEEDGRHDRGYDVLSPLEEEFWHSIRARGGSNSSHATIKVRRNVVLDSQDQRMQLALALYEPPMKLSNGLKVSLCLLTMEEDEASDSGFPSCLQNAEDEHFICTNEDRFALNSALTVAMATGPDAAPSSLTPLARICTVSDQGTIDYTLDGDGYSNDSQEDSDATNGRSPCFQFRHEETGAILQLDLSLLVTNAGGGSYMSLQEREQQRSQSDSEERAIVAHAGNINRNISRSVMEEDDEEEEEAGEDLDRFEDDGFLVGEDDDSEIQGNFSGNDDDGDACCLCRDGGELMVCDGGPEMDGCQKSFHHQCVGRALVPEGDWICSDCAKSGGYVVGGQEGFEFEGSASASSSTRHRHLTEGDSSQEPDEASVATNGITFVGDGDTSDEEGNAEIEAPVHGRSAGASSGQEASKRRRILEDSEDDDE